MLLQELDKCWASSPKLVVTAVVLNGLKGYLYQF